MRANEKEQHMSTSTSNPFAAPASASGISWEDLNGRLLVIEPHAVEHAVSTSLGPKDAVRADVHVIDVEPEDYEDVLIFPRVLISQLSSRVGQKVLGRLGQGVAKPGQSAPWLISSEVSPADQQAGLDWLSRATRKPFAAPAAQPERVGGYAAQPPF